MKKFELIILSLFTSMTYSQVKKSTGHTLVPKSKPDLVRLNEQIPALIPQKRDGKFGFINQKGKIVIKPEYSNVGFFTEDCNLLNSANQEVRKFGTSEYASGRKDGVDFRIDMTGKRAYQFKDADLAQCPFEFKKQRYYSYIKNGYYGIVEGSTFLNPEDYRHYKIYPQYLYLHIMEGEDLDNPMIVASMDNQFGVIDINNRVIVPFEYADIKRNFSWKLAKLFEVTKDGKNYFFVDSNNKTY